MEDKEKDNNKAEDKITFFSLLKETIVSLFLSSTESVEEKKDYSVKGKWKIWVDKTFYLKKTKKKKLIQSPLAIFILFNIIIFFIVCFGQSVGRPNAKAKVYMSAAATVNMLYIFPISKIFGWDNILVKPIYPIRNGLYNTGLKLLPKGDGEREMWWFLVKFKEYDELIDTEILDYTVKGKIFPKEKIKKFYEKTDELYDHLEPLATMKIRDPYLRERRYGTWIGVAWMYEKNEHSLLGEIEQKKGLTARYIKKQKDFYKFVKIYNMYKNLKAFTKKYEPEGLNYFYNKTTRYAFESLLEHDISHVAIYRGINLCTFSCSDPFVKVFGDSYTKLYKDYLHDSKIPYNNRRYISFRIGPSKEEVIMLKECPNRPYLDSVKEYANSDIKAFNQLTDPRYINEWKKYKETKASHGILEP